MALCRLVQSCSDEIGVGGRCPASRGDGDQARAIAGPQGEAGGRAGGKAAAFNIGSAPWSTGGSRDHPHEFSERQTEHDGKSDAAEGGHGNADYSQAITGVIAPIIACRPCGRSLGKPSCLISCSHSSPEGGSGALITESNAFRIQSQSALEMTRGGRSLIV